MAKKIGYFEHFNNNQKREKREEFGDEKIE